MRPNIRVEIQNNLAESMEVDEIEENEEGEISDKEEDKVHVIEPIKFDQNTPDKNSRLNVIFTTGINILDKKEQEKRQERAKRFQLNPDEIKNFTDADLKLLHLSLGISPANEQNVRFEAVHVRGISGATPREVLEYFLEYAPVCIEFVSEETCNIVWLDPISSMRALYFISKAVRGMPVRDDSSYFGNLQEGEEDDANMSVLLVNKDREVELQEDEDHLSISKSSKFNDTNSVDISEITTTIPPGFWRLGSKKLLSKSLLLRFSLKTDKKPYKTEHFSKHYKVQGKPTNRSDSQQGIFDRNKDLSKKPAEKNPWSALAENWDEDAKFRERERLEFVDEPKIEIKNPSLRVRLGEKRKNVEDSEKNEVEEPEEKVIIEEKPKKTKIPRMRMYADEEEEKIKRKKLLKRLDSEYKKIEENKGAKSDLRKVLNMTNRNAGLIPEPEPEVFDLGSTLKNRRKMVFEIKTEMNNYERPVKQDIRSRLSATKEKEKEPIIERAKPREQRERRRDTSVESRIRHRHRRRYSEEEEEYGEVNKPRSKVAVVIRTQKRPTVASAVASTLYSRRNKNQSSESNSETEEVSSSSPSESEEQSDEDEVKVETGVRSRVLSKRPGFSHLGEKLSENRSPLKIEISNDHFKRT